MKQFIQRLLFGYRPNPKAETPRSGSKLTQLRSAQTFNEYSNNLKQQLK
jgi:hypothetical protein